MIVDEAAYLEHYGVKGMRWGVRNDRRLKGAKQSSVSNKQPSNNSSRKRVVRNIAIGLGALAVVAGSAYAAKTLSQNKKLSSNNIPKASVKVGEAAAKRVTQGEPTSVVMASRGKNRGFRFIKNGGVPDPLVEYMKSSLLKSETQGFEKYDGGKVAVSFLNPDGLKDKSGRVIPISLVIPKSQATGINSTDDVLKSVWPQIKDAFLSNYNDSALEDDF